MKIHHLNCGTYCPLGRQHLIGGNGSLVSHCLLIELPGELVLIDTGLGLKDISQDPRRTSLSLTFLARPELREEETAIRQIQALGFKHSDVRHIILTHLDLDHAGGVSDFPEATVHLHRPEYQQAINPTGPVYRKDRYRQEQWAKVSHWERYPIEGESWRGFDCIRQLKGLPPEIALLPLSGHTAGHSGILIERPTGWMLHAGDAYFDHRELDPKPHVPKGIKIFEELMDYDTSTRKHNQKRLAQLKHDHADVDIFCSHDPLELQRHHH